MENNELITHEWFRTNYSWYIKRNISTSLYNNCMTIGQLKYYYFVDESNLSTLNGYPMYNNINNKDIVMVQKDMIIPKRDKGANSTVICISKNHVNNNERLLGGTFTEFNGKPYGKIVKIFTTIHSDSYGLVDETFNVDGTGFDDQVNVILTLRTTQPPYEDYYVIGGIFKTYNGVISNNLIILNKDGNILKAFGTSINSGIKDLMKHPNIENRFYVVGGFTNAFSTNYSHIMLLDNYGNLDNINFTRTNFPGPITSIQNVYSQTSSTTSEGILVQGLFSLTNYWSEQKFGNVAMRFDGSYYDRLSDSAIGLGYSPLSPNGELNGYTQIWGSTTITYGIGLAWGNFGSVSYNNHNYNGLIYTTVGERLDSTPTNMYKIYPVSGSVTKVIKVAHNYNDPSGSYQRINFRLFIFGNFNNLNFYKNNVLVRSSYPGSLLVLNAANTHSKDAYITPEDEHIKRFYGGVQDAQDLGNGKILCVGDFREYGDYIQNYVTIIGTNLNIDIAFAERMGDLL